MSNNLDQLFKKAFQDDQSEPPVHIWKNIEQRLEKKHRNKVAAWWLYGIAASALIAALTIDWFIGKEETDFQEMEWITQVPATLPPISTPKVLLDDNPIQVVSNEQFEDSLFLPDLSASPEKMNMLADSIRTLSSEKAKIIFEAPKPALKNGVIRKDFIPLTSKEAVRNNETYLALLQESQPEKKERKKMKVVLSGHFIPAYSSATYSSTVKNARGNNYSQEQMTGLMNAGGGLRISVATGKRISVQTGIYYIRMGQKTAESMTNPQVMYPTLTNAGTGVVTPWGNIKNYRRNVTYRTTLTNVNKASSQPESLEQTFGTLSIPLQVRCRLNNNRISFFLNGGFSGNIVVDNKVYLKSGSDREYLGETEDIRDFNISTDLSLGVEYPISSRFKVMLEPGFKYYLQSLSQNANIDFKPYLFTLSTGIGIAF